MPAPNRVVFKVGEEDAGRRLDQVLAARVPGLSRRQARLLLDIGGVFVDGRRIKIAGRPMHEGEEVVAVMGGALARATQTTGRAARAARTSASCRRSRSCSRMTTSSSSTSRSGLLTAPTPESDRNNLADSLARRAEPPAPITWSSTASISRPAAWSCSRRPRTRTASCRTVPRPRFGARLPGRGGGALPRRDVRVIDRPVAGAARSRTSRSASDSAIGATLVACRLETGRTHQIRLHMAEVGTPVIGDGRYGRPCVAGAAPDGAARDQAGPRSPADG